MLDFEEFQNEKYESQKKLGGIKKNKLQVKMNNFKKQKQEIKPVSSDVGGSNYYDRYNGNKFI